MSPDRHHVITDRGRIVARRVIVATNAFTRELLPEMRMHLPRQSQIMLTEHARDRTRGRIVTSEQGPAYFNQPRGGARNGRAPLFSGGGDDRPMENPASRRRSRECTICCSAARRYFPSCADSRRLLNGSGRWPSRPTSCRRSDSFAPGSSWPPATTDTAAATRRQPGKPAQRWRSPTNPPIGRRRMSSPRAPVPQQTPSVPLVQG